MNPLSFMRDEVVPLARKNPEEVENLGDLFYNYATTHKMPLIIYDRFAQYKKIVNMLKSMKDNMPEPVYKALYQYLEKNPPISGGGIGNHVSYEMMNHRDDMIALAELFINCYKEKGFSNKDVQED